jgi:flagellar operon protein
MADIKTGVTPPFVPIGGFDRVNQKPRVIIPEGRSFKDIFHDQIKTEELSFSSHAQKRLHSRNINLTEEDLSNLTNAVHKAESKGAKESLILMRDHGFIVSIPNKKVITAVNQEELKENVFTNIDSAVIV